jgi:hypothetical protein
MFLAWFLLKVAFCTAQGAAAVVVILVEWPPFVFSTLSLDRGRSG